MSTRKLLFGAVAAVLAIAPSAASAQSSGTIAYQQEGGPQEGVFTIPASGGTPTFLNAGQFPSVSPNGQTVAFIVSTSLTGAGTLMTIPAAGGTATTVTNAQLSDQPAWSPSGGQLAYLFNDDLMLVNASGGSAKRVVNGTSKVAVGPGAFLSSSKLIYLQGAVGGSGCGVLPKYAVRTIGTNGTNGRAVNVKVPGGWCISGASLSVSASKSTIAFSVRKGNAFAIAVAPAAGGTAKVVNGYYAADFGPSGNQLCAQAGGDGTGALSIITTTGSVVSSLGVTGTGCSWG
jgi:Tol biopolymer transport system component